MFSRHGVEVFFVISRFVIAHSLRNFVANPRSAFLFILRRQLRLDPPYWAAIAFALLALIAERSIRSAHSANLPPVPTVNVLLLNMTYLYKIVHASQFLPVAWTLCIEIQFYLAFMAVLAFGGAMTGFKSLSSTTFTNALIAILGLGSIAFRIHFDSSVWFTSYWCYFACGVLCCRALNRPKELWFYVVLQTGLLAAAVWMRDRSITVAAITGLVIFLVGTAGCLTTLSGGAALQFVGRISNSLYLVHVTVLSVVLRTGYKLTRENQPAAVAWFIFTTFLCVAIAYMFFLMVERPSLRFASRFSAKNRPQNSIRTAELNWFPLSSCSRFDMTTPHTIQLTTSGLSDDLATITEITQMRDARVSTITRIAKDTIKPHLTIQPTSGWAPVNLRDLWHFRDLIFTLGNRDLKVRYKQTELGVAWVVLQPLIAAGIFAFVFGRVAKISTDGVPPFLFSFVGLLGWNLFNTTLIKTSGCLVGNAHLISKVFFPRLVLPLSGLHSTLVDFAVSLGMLMVLFAIYRVAPGPAVVLLPVWIVVLFAMSMGIGLIAAALAVTYRDVGYILPVFSQILLYASPVAYPLSAVPARLRPFYALNPLTGVLEAFRSSLLAAGPNSQTHYPPLGYLAYSIFVAAVLLILGTFSFKHMEHNFSDVI